MDSAAPTVLALETDSAWAVILAVSAGTLVAAVVLHRLIARPGGLASAALLATPLVLPLAAAAAYERALLPELAVLRPAGEVMLERSRDLLHLFLLPDPTNHSVTRRRSSTPSPRRVIRSARATSSTPPSATSATSRRVEFVPRSIAPTRTWIGAISLVY